MSTGKIVVLCLLGFFLFSALAIGIYCLSVNNTEVSLRNQFEAQKKVNEATFDAMWKILAGKAEVANEYKEAFRQIYPEIINGRYADKNLLFKFVKESNPKFDIALYKSLSNSIEAERKKFLLAQEKQIDIKRQHDNLRLKTPSRFIVGSSAELELVIITSEKTEEVFKSGREDDTELFKKKK